MPKEPLRIVTATLRQHKDHFHLEWDCAFCSDGGFVSIPAGEESRPWFVPITCDTTGKTFAVTTVKQ